MPRVYLRGRTYYSDFYSRGKRIQRPLSTDKRIAIQKLGELLKARDAEKHGHAPTGENFQAFKDRLFAHIEARLDHDSVTKYRRAFASIRLASIDGLTPEYLDRLVSDWQRDGIGKYEINARITKIKAAMRRAEAWGYVQPQRWNTVKELKTPRGRLLFYTQDEAGLLLKECSGSWLTVAMLGLYAGLRRSEIAALRWQDVDFPRNRIHVTPYDGFMPKDYEARWVTMAKPLRACLQDCKRSGDLVLGRKWHVEVVSTQMRRIIRKAGLPGSVHTLRHTFAAWLASAGVPLYTISKLLGHSTVRTTEIYAHLAPDSQAAAVSVLPQL